MITKSGTPKGREQFVERMGDFMAQAGQPRIAGRLLGWLLVCEPPEQSADQLIEATGASKGSVSTMLRLLQATGCVETGGRSGERRTYYRIRPEMWSEMLRSQLEKMSELKTIAEEGLAMMAAAPEEARGRLEGMRALYAFFEGEWPALVDRWNAERDS